MKRIATVIAAAFLIVVGFGTAAFAAEPTEEQKAQMREKVQQQHEANVEAQKAKVKEQHDANVAAQQEKIKAQHEANVAAQQEKVKAQHEANVEFDVAQGIRRQRTQGARQRAGDVAEPAHFHERVGFRGQEQDVDGLCHGGFCDKTLKVRATFRVRLS